MESCDWYKDVMHYLQFMYCPLGMNDNEKRALKLQYIKYVIVNGKPWSKNMKDVLLKCTDQEGSIKILNEMHGGVCGVN